jgi:hypothetical protein
MENLQPSTFNLERTGVFRLGIPSALNVEGWALNVSERDFP